MNFEKRSIVEVINELGVDLELAGGGSRPYYKGLCPFHDDHNPTMIVYESVQRVACPACWAEGGDVIDFVMKLKECSFPAALKIATDRLPDVVAAVKRIERLAAKKDDMLESKMILYATFCKNLFQRLDIADALQVQSEADELWNSGKIAEAMHVVQLLPEA